MEMESLRDLYTDELKDLLSAENQILKALPKMAKKASNPGLQQAFEIHLEETRGHVQRLEQVFENLGVPARAKKCKGMQGLLEEAKEMMEEADDDEVRDAAMIGSAQRVEHYEIAAYGTVRAYAKLLGDEQSARLLQQTLDEEGATDKKLTQLAESQINVQAMEGEDA
jgi:ferritin-like metal-binding protein YciE